MFFDRFEELCRLKGVRPGTACTEMGLSRSLASKWKNTKTEKPSADALEKMSKYFQMSIDEILGLLNENEKRPVYDDEAWAMMKEMYERPELRALFKTTKNVKPEAIKAVDELLKSWANGENDDI